MGDMIRREGSPDLYKGMKGQRKDTVNLTGGLAAWRAHALRMAQASRSSAGIEPAYYFCSPLYTHILGL